MADNRSLFRYLKRKYSRKYRSQHKYKYLRSDNGTLLVLLFLLSRSHAFTVNQLTQAMVTAQQGLISNGMLNSPSDIAVTGLYQTLFAGVGSLGTHMPLSTATPIPFPGVVSHIPLVHNYLLASSSPKETVFRGSLVIIFYSACGFANFISPEFATSLAPGMVLFAQFMVANSCLVVFPQSYSLKRKLLSAFLLSGGAIRIIRKIPAGLRSYKNLCIRSFDLGFKIGTNISEKFDSSNRPNLRIRKKNYLKIVFLALNLENLII